MKRRASIVFCALAALLISFPVLAQKITGDLTGTVRDASGAVVPNATLVLTSPATGLKRQVQTGTGGEYRINDLPIGSYRLEATAGGFTTTARQVEIAAAAVTTADFKLQVGGKGEVVTVEGEAPMVEYSANLNSTLGSETLRETPLSGRDFQQIMNYEPGVIRQPGGGFQTISINGQREDSNNYFIDGFYNNDRYYGDAAIGQTGIVGIPATIVPPDALQEMTVQALPSAEFGVKSGAPVLMNFKSGTNSFHGSAQWFRHTEVTDAANYFSKHQEGGCTAPNGDCRSPLKNNQFGGLFGGPIIKDKTFFLMFYEGQRLSFESPFQALVPTPSEVATARANIAAAGLTPNVIGENLLSFYPQDPSGSVVVNIPTTAKLDSGGIKIDHRLTTNQTLAGRYILADSFQSAVAFTGTLAPPPTPCCGETRSADMFNSIAPSRAQILGLSHTWNIGSSKVLESRIGMTRFSQLIGINNNVNPAALGLNTGPLDPGDYGVPAVYYLSDFGYIGGVGGYPITTRPNQTYDWSEHFSWVKGSHSIKIGGNLQHAYSNDLRNRARTVLDIYPVSGLSETQDHVNALTELLLGRFDDAGRSFGDTHRRISQSSYGLYVQDEWKFRPRLTLSFGLRYDIAGNMNEERDRASNFLPDRGLVKVGQGISSLWNIDKNNFGPRFGFAWDVTGNGKTALRGGYALTYDLPLMGAVHAPRLGSVIGDRAGAYTNPDLGVVTGFLSGDFAVPGGDPTATCVDPATGVGNVVCAVPGVPLFGAGGGVFPPFGAFAVDRNLKTAMVHNYQMSLQNEVLKNNVLTVAYVGSLGRDEYAYRDLNAPPVSATPQPRPFAAAFPNLDHIVELNNDSKSWYDSLQVSYKQHAWNGFTTVASYTWSNCRDYNSNSRSGRTQFFQAQNPYNPAENKGPCSIDVKHKFDSSVVYAVPNFGLGRFGSGWELINTVDLSTGLPFSATLGSDDPSGQDTHSIRADWNGTPVKYNTRNPDQYIANPEVFSIPAPGTIGNSGRDMLRAPGFAQWNATLSKTTRITEQLSATFRWEVYNVLNRANFGWANLRLGRGNIESSSFGVISSTPDVDAINPLAEGGARAMQFAVKFQF